jgi:hypothetical protein
MDLLSGVVAGYGRGMRLRGGTERDRVQIS